MRINYIAARPGMCDQCELLLQPENDADRKNLERLVRDDVAAGFGRDATTGELLHVSVAILRGFKGY